MALGDNPSRLWTVTNIQEMNKLQENYRSVDRWRINDLREEIGMQLSLVGRIVSSWMMWVRLVHMKVGRLPKRALAVEQRGCRKRCRLQLRWEDTLRGMRERTVERKAEGMNCGEKGRGDELWRERQRGMNSGKVKGDEPWRERQRGMNCGEKGGGG